MSKTDWAKLGSYSREALMELEEDMEGGLLRAVAERQQAIEEKKQKKRKKKKKKRART